MDHELFCDGGHDNTISCAEMARLRTEFEANPWYCKGATRSGYHLFSRPKDLPLDAQCEYEGCDRTWGELKQAT